MNHNELIESLLFPRMIVTANYPGSNTYAVDQIIDINEMNANGIKHHLEVYPHLFRRLEWYEKRSWEILFEVRFVKVISKPGYYVVGDHLEVCGYEIENERFKRPLLLGYRVRKDSGYGDAQTFKFKDLLPITEDQYIEHWKTHK